MPVRGHRRRARQLRVRPHQRLPAGHRRRLRLALDGPQVRPAPRRRGHRRWCASRARASARRSSTRWCGSTPSTAPTRRPRKDRIEFQKLTPLYATERLRLETDVDQPDRSRHRHRGPDRQGPARPDRVAVQGRQDDDHAVDRELDHHEQPRVPPDGGAGRRASRGGHRLRALGQGRGHLLDVRPPRQRPHDGRRARDRARQAAGRARPRRGRAARRHHPAGPRLQPRRPGAAAGSCPVVSTRPRSTRRSASSVPPATSRTAAR